MIARNNLRVHQQLGVALAIVTPLRDEIEKVLAADEGHVGDRHAQPEVHRVAEKRGAGGVGPDADDRIGARCLQYLHLIAHDAREFGAPPVGRLADDPLAERSQGTAHARPTTAAVSVSLIEDCDALAADPDEVLNQAGRLLPVGGAQIEGEGAVWRLPLRLGAGEREEEIDLSLLKLLEHGKDARDRRRPDIAEQGEDLVFQHQGHRVLNRRIGLIAVVIGPENDSSAPDATVAVDVLEIGTGPAEELYAETAGRTGERGGRAQHDLAVGHAAAPDGRQPRPNRQPARPYRRTLLLVGDLIRGMSIPPRLCGMPEEWLPASLHDGKGDSLGCSSSNSASSSVASSSVC